MLRILLYLSMPTIAEVTDHLEFIAPLSLQESYDNCGLLTGERSGVCTGILCTLDVTPAVVKEAILKNCNCIVAHHPLLFKGLKQITPTGFVEKSIIEAIKNNIAIYAAHTNYDAIINGVNGRIADKLGLVQRSFLWEKTPETGSGLVGDLALEMSAESFLHLLKDRFHLQLVRFTHFRKSFIKKIAVCGGAGSFLISKALSVEADAYVTADIKYHEFFEAEGKLLLCDIGHYESEQFTKDLFLELLLQKFPTFAVLKSEVKTNPVNYFTGI